MLEVVREYTVANQARVQFNEQARAYATDEELELEEQLVARWIETAERLVDARDGSPELIRAQLEVARDCRGSPLGDKALNAAYDTVKAFAPPPNGYMSQH
jgi:hypothetical protein